MTGVEAVDNCCPAVTVRRARDGFGRDAYRMIPAPPDGRWRVYREINILSDESPAVDRARLDAYAR
jgi:hypothetical protein